MGRKKKRPVDDYEAQNGRKSEPASVGLTFAGEAVSTRSHLLLYLPFALLALAVFTLTMCPTVPGGDSGELISVAYSLGVAHPPGYPLYTMIAHLATYLPIGSVAWRVNFLSAVFALLTGYIISLIVIRWLKEKWLGIFAAGLYLFSPVVWRYCIVAEVFGLNNFFIALLIYLTLRFLEEPTRKWALWWAATLGLACSHHHTILFLAIPLFSLLMYKHYRLLLSARVFGPCLAVFAIGFLPYLYLPWASQKQLFVSWGETETWQGFLTHFLRKEYGTFKLATGESNIMNVFSNLMHYAMDLWYQFLYVGIALVAFSIWQFLKKDRKNDFFGSSLLWTWVFYTLVFHLLANMDLSNRLFYDVQSRFWMLPNMILALFCAYGVRELANRWPQYKQRLFIAVTTAVIALQVGLNWRMEDMSKNTIFYDLGKSLLDGVPKDSLIFMRGDIYVNAIRYLQEVEKHRTDVKSIPFDLFWWPWMRGLVEKHYADVKFPGKVYRYKRMTLGEFTLADFFEANKGKFPLYIGKLADYEVQNLTTKFRMIPVGYLNKVVPLGTPFDVVAYQKEVEGFAGFKVPSKDDIRDKSWEAFVYYNYWDREMEKAKLVFGEAQQIKEPVSHLFYGMKILERVVAEYPEAPPGVYRNLGVAYQLLARNNVLYLPKMVQVWKKYLESNPKDDPQLNSIQQAVFQYGGAITVTAPPRNPSGP